MKFIFDIIVMKTKGNRLLKCLCLAAVMTVAAGNVWAQDLKSVLSGVVKSVVGDKTTTESSIIGTWTYAAPECQFESDNLRAKAGGEMTAKEVEEKIQAVYEKVGMEGCQYTFGEDGSYSCTIKGKTSSGTYIRQRCQDRYDERQARYQDRGIRDRHW